MGKGVTKDKIGTKLKGREKRREVSGSRVGRGGGVGGVVVGGGGGGGGGVFVANEGV